MNPSEKISIACKKLKPFLNLEVRKLNSYAGNVFHSLTQEISKELRIGAYSIIPLKNETNLVIRTQLK